MGALGFAAPWLLIALGGLPLLWWLLRATPPSPRRIPFPALRILLQLANTRQTAARTPPWLMALRLLLTALAIIGAAHPLLQPVPVGADRPLLLVVDNGWAAAPAWRMRHNQMVNLVEEADKAQQRVAILTTAPPADGGAVSLIGPLAAHDAKAAIEALQPLPWPTDRQAARAALAGLTPSWHIVWLSDGLSDFGARQMGHDLEALGALELVRARPPIKRITGINDDGTGTGQQLDIHLTRSDAATPEIVVLRALDGTGRILARQPVTWESGIRDLHALFDLPTALRNQTQRIDIEGEDSVGATFLLDDRWRRRTVGLADEGQNSASPLLDDLYYTERALAPIAEVHRAPLDDLITQAPSLIVLPDGGALTDTDIDSLKNWIARGGVLLRLAGPKLASNPDELLPVALRDSRILGGAMSWDAPMALAAMPETGPYAGLTVPADIRVRTQMLAEPGPDLGGRVWAHLTDGTPLITGRAMGKGWLVLIHTTVGPAWSDLGLSGLYPQLLSRLIALSQGMAPDSAGQPAPPNRLLDGFAHLGRPTSAALPLPPSVPSATALQASPVSVGPHHPPGFYGRATGERRALNLDNGSLVPLPTPPHATTSWLSDQPPERDLQGGCLGLALLLLLIDTLAVRHLRGELNLQRPLRALFGIGLTAFVLAFPLYHSARAEPSPAAALQTRLAYVVTNDHALDDISRNGLSGLSRMVNRRTTAQLADPQAVDLERDTLVLYPLIYWPVSETQSPPSEAARAKINQFIRHGGIILFDSRDRGQNGPLALHRLTAGLDIPPLTPITRQHVLSRTFYLLKDFPGRFAGLPVYVEEEADAANDGVSPVVAGGNDWAAAWASDRNGRPLFPEVPDDENQREMAFRFGINLVMYALTGTYKSDQVHLQALLERMKR